MARGQATLRSERTDTKNQKKRRERHEKTQRITSLLLALVLAAGLLLPAVPSVRATDGGSATQKADEASPAQAAGGEAESVPEEWAEAEKRPSVIQGGADEMPDIVVDDDGYIHSFVIKHAYTRPGDFAGFYYDGITAGTDDTHFSPYKTVMRCDSMVFFWAAKGRPAHADIQSPFKDVKKKHWFYDAVLWAVENHITAGTDATHFSPNNTCSRSEILQFFYAAMNRPGYSISNPYSDVKPKHWYYDGAIWAYEKGLEKGEDGKFNAKTPCTRAYVVTYLYRFITGQELAK